MDEGTALVLAVQLTALCSIAGSLLVYLLCKARRVYDVEVARFGSGRSVLVTSCETGLGLQLALHLTSLGFRVFAGVKEDPPETCQAARVLRAKLKAAPDWPGTLVVVPLDVTREDSLHEAVDTVRRHLPAGHNGLWGVINTAGVVVKGRLEGQESCQWESMFKVNVVGTLRTARVFLPLLKNAKGRLLTIGLTGECYNGTGVVAYAAARHAVAGASNALSNELAHLGVNVVTINTGTITADALYHQVRVRVEEQIEPNVQPTDPYLRYKVNALPRYALRIIEQILLSDIPKLSYDLVPPVGLSIYFTAISEKFNSNKQPAPLNTV